MENSPQPQQDVSDRKRLVDIDVTDENGALNMIISFAQVAQSRGAYTMEESAKILSCINIFKKN